MQLAGCLCPAAPAPPFPTLRNSSQALGLSPCHPSGTETQMTPRHPFGSQAKAATSTSMATTCAHTCLPSAHASGTPRAGVSTGCTGHANRPSHSPRLLSCASTHVLMSPSSALSSGRVPLQVLDGQPRGVPAPAADQMLAAAQFAAHQGS